MREVLAIDPLGWWVEGDDSAAHSAEPLAAQIKPQMGARAGRAMSLPESLPRQGSGRQSGL
eukprot:684536-Pyramimonas_sp.AAC.1